MNVRVERQKINVSKNDWLSALQTKTEISYLRRITQGTGLTLNGVKTYASIARSIGIDCIDGMKYHNFEFVVS